VKFCSSGPVLLWFRHPKIGAENAVYPYIHFFLLTAAGEEPVIQ